jgi:hypothetical protein
MYSWCVTHRYEKKTNLIFRVETKCGKHLLENIREMRPVDRLTCGREDDRWILELLTGFKVQRRASVTYFVVRNNSFIQTTSSHPIPFLILSSYMHVSLSLLHRLKHELHIEEDFFHHVMEKKLFVRSI